MQRLWENQPLQHMCQSSKDSTRPSKGGAQKPERGKPQYRQRSRSRRGRGGPRSGGPGSGWKKNQQKTGGKPSDVQQQEYYEYDLPDQFEQLSFECVTLQQTVDAISRDTDTRDELFANLDIKLPDRPGQHKLKMKVDTGAQGNILPVRTFRRMFPQALDSSGFPKPGSTKPRQTRLTA